MIPRCTYPNAPKDDSQKPTKTREKDKMPPTSGPSSANPGRWLTDVYTYTTEEDRDSEAFQSALAILESYRPGPRLRALRHPILESGHSVQEMTPANQFTVETESLETKSLCYSSEVSPGADFSMWGQEGALPQIKVSEWPTSRVAELADYKPRKVRAARATGGISVPKRERQPVSQSHIDVQYAAWLQSPSGAHEESFWNSLYIYCARKAASGSAADKLRKQGHSEDFLQDFLSSLYRGLEKKRTNGDRIAEFSHYLNRAWRRRQISALKALKEYDLRNPSSTPMKRRDDDVPTRSGYCLDDGRDFAQSNMDVSSVESVDLDGEAILKSREAKLPSLKPEIADYVGCKLLGLKDRQIAAKWNRSRQAIGRIKKNAQRALQIPVMGDAA